MDIFEALLSSSQSSGVSPELLETLGKQAAGRFLEKGVALNDSVADLVSKHPELQNEHIKRIVEFANNEAFQQLFQNSEDKNVHFDVADPGVVLREVKDGGSPAHDGKVLNEDNKMKGSRSDVSDYSTPSDSSNPTDSADFETAFSDYAQKGQDGGGEEQAKLGAACRRPGDPRPKRRKRQGDAGRPRPPRPARANFGKDAVDHNQHANPIDDVYDTHLGLEATTEKLAEAYTQFETMLKEAQEHLYQEVKREVLDPDGAGLPEVIEAVKIASPSHSMAFKMLKPIAERLVKEGAIHKTARADFEKVGSFQMPNTGHPILQATAGVLKLAQEKVRAQTALADASSGLEQTEAFLRGLK